MVSHVAGDWIPHDGHGSGEESGVALVSLLISMLKNKADIILKGG